MQQHELVYLILSLLKLQSVLNQQGRNYSSDPSWYRAGIDHEACHSQSLNSRAETSFGAYQMEEYFAGQFTIPMLPMATIAFPMITKAKCFSMRSLNAQPTVTSSALIEIWYMRGLQSIWGDSYQADNWLWYRWRGGSAWITRHRAIPQEQILRSRKPLQYWS